MTRDEMRERFGARLLQVGVFAVIAAAFAGLVTGTRQVPPQRGYTAAVAAPPPAPGDAPRAVSYLGWRTTRLGPNADLYEGAFEALIPHGKGEELLAQNPEALAARAARRAYEGAPPTIPHRVEAIATNECTACHDHGAAVFGKTAPIPGHRERSVCTQCHVPEQAAIPGGPPLTENTFAGLGAASPSHTAPPLEP
jgi:nitrate reductase (cytochrome), electron transfer subunit